MKEWNGLLKKEWAMMKGWLSGVAISALILLLAAGYGLVGYVGEYVRKTDVIGITVLLWMLIILFFPVTTLLNSLIKEWKRPDVWLHSERSIFKLFGSKLFFAAVGGLIAIILPAIGLFIYAGISDSMASWPMSELLLLVGVILYSFHAMSLLIACVGLFFGVLYQLLKPVVAGFTIPILLVIFGLSSMVIQKIGATDFYEKVKKFGPMGDFSREELQYGNENFYIGPVEAYVYTGDVLLTGVSIVTLFVVASVLFEKKVRF